MSSSPVSQLDRVIAALRKYPHGLTAADFAAPNVVDGGKPIMRLSARMNDLKQRGGSYRKTTDANGLARYRLVSLPPGYDEVRELRAAAEQARRVAARPAPQPALSAATGVADGRRCAIFDFDDFDGD